MRNLAEHKVPETQIIEWAFQESNISEENIYRNYLYQSVENQTLERPKLLNLGWLLGCGLVWYYVLSVAVMTFQFTENSCYKIILLRFNISNLKL